MQNRIAGHLLYASGVAAAVAGGGGAHTVLFHSPCTRPRGGTWYVSLLSGHNLNLVLLNVLDQTVLEFVEGCILPLSAM